MNVRYRVNHWAFIGLLSALLSSSLMYATVLQAQAAPTLRIVAPADGSTVDRPVTIRIEHAGIRFDGVQIGGTNEAGVGHWHVYVDDKFAGLAPTNVIELPNDAYPTITAGRHKITATLNENNHAPLNPPVSQTIELNFSKDVSIPVTQGGTPSVQVIFPTANATIDAPFVARIEHSGFRMDGINSGKDAEPGTGHWHINIDGRYAGMSVSRVLELPNNSFPTITAGQHTLTFYVHQNNHVATNPPVAASIRINVSKDLKVATASAQPTTAATQAKPTTEATSAGASPTVRATGTTEATGTLAATGTPNATGTTDATGTPAANLTASAGPSATIGLPGIPNTGAVAENITLPSSVAIMCLIIGSMLLYWSRVGSFEAAASASSGRQLSVNLGTSFTQPLLRVLRQTDARPAQRLAHLLQQLNAQPVVIRLNISATNLMRARTAMAFSGGAITGFSLSAILILMWTAQPTTYISQPVVSGPVVSAPAAPITDSDVAVAPITVPETTRVFGPVAATLPWPALLPSGMEFAAEDSWPLRVMSSNSASEPFLVFRDERRSLIVRYADGSPQGSTEPFKVAGTEGALSHNADGSFQATWQQDGRTVEMSGVGLSSDDIARITTSFKPMSSAQLQAQLVKEAAHRQLNITLLWPDYMPAGVNLVTGESIVELSQPGTVPNEDRYQLVFRGGQTTVKIGGGTDTAPATSGVTENFTVGNVTGQLTSGERRYLLTLDAGNAEEASLNFAPLRDAAGRQLPMLQQGKVYVSAENLDRAQFERIVAGLFALRSSEFQAQARGQMISSLRYMWPTSLPEGFTVDLGSVTYANTNAILLGARAYYAMSATGPNGDTITLQGGRNADGSAFVVKEGPDVEQFMTKVHGRGATAVRTPEGQAIVWSDGSSSYQITSATVELEQLLAVAQGMARLDSDDWERYRTKGPDISPGVTRPRPLEASDATTVFTLEEIPEISQAVAANAKGVIEADVHTASLESAPHVQQIPVALPAAPDRVVIPGIGLDTPIFSVDATVPKHNVGWYKHSGRPSQGTNIVLWGHVMRWKDSPNIAAPFADVHLLGIGDPIILVSETGEKFRYAITKQIRVTPDKVSYLAPTEHEQLLLISCIGDKIVVNGELTKAERLLTIAEPVN